MVRIKSKKFSSIRDAQEYQKIYYDSSWKNSDACPFGEGIVQELHWQKRVSIARKYIHNKYKVLDLGCGDGTVTRQIAQNAQKVIGIDISGECIQRAIKEKSHPRVEYINIPFEEYVSPFQFNVILMFEIIEHVFDPLLVLKKANLLLTEGGLLILSTPNFSSLVRRMKKVLNPLVLKLGYKDAKEIAPEHIREYTYSEMKQMLFDSGFKIINTDGIILLFPFIEILKKLTKNRIVHALNFWSGNLCPQLALEMYFMGQKKVNPIKIEK